jgi:predicted transcriptional regulator
MLFETCYYTVEIIDGDYAHLKKEDEDTAELKLVARALLPEAITVGSRLKYEMLQYELV